MFLMFCFWATSISWWMLGSLATDTTCDENCADYHRICPAVQNQTFYEEYSAKHSSGQLGIFSNGPLPPPPDCENGFYQTACPRSCEICISCEGILLEKSILENSDKSPIKLYGSPSKNGDLNGTPVPQDDSATATEEESSPSESGDLNGTPGPQDDSATATEEETVKLKLIYDKGDKGHSARFPLSQSVDGDPYSIYASVTMSKPSVEYSFDKEYSVGEVFYVGHPYSPYFTENDEISICDDNGCTLCGTLVEQSSIQFETSCDNKRGKKIKVQEPAHGLLYIGEIEVWGTEI